LVMMFHKRSPTDPSVYTEISEKDFKEIVAYVHQQEPALSVVTLEQLLADQEASMSDLRFNSDFNGVQGEAGTGVPFDSSYIVPAVQKTETMSKHDYDNATALALHDAKYGISHVPAPGTTVQEADKQSEAFKSGVNASWEDTTLVAIPRDNDLDYPLMGIAGVKKENAVDLYNLPAPLFKVPVRSPVAGGLLDQEFFISYPIAELGLGTVPGTLIGDKYYVIDTKGNIYHTAAMEQSLYGVIKESAFRGVDDVTAEAVYRLTPRINKPGVYYLVIDHQGTLLKSNSFEVSSDPFSDLAKMTVESYDKRSTKYYSGIPRTTYLADKDGNTIKTIENMPPTMMPEGNTRATTQYLAETYNIWGLFLHSDDQFVTENKLAMQTILMEQTPWMLAMQVQEGPFKGTVYQDEGDIKFTTSLRYNFADHDRVIRDVDENNYSTVVTAEYAGAMSVAAGLFAENGNQDMAVASAKASLRAWRFLDAHPDSAMFAMEGSRDPNDIDDRMMAAVQILEFAEAHPDLYYRALSEENGVYPTPDYLAGYIKTNMGSLKSWLTFEGDRHDNVVFSHLALLPLSIVQKYGLQKEQSLSRAKLLELGDSIVNLAERNMYEVGVTNDKHDAWAYGSNRNKMDKARWLLIADEVYFRQAGKESYDTRYLNAAYGLWSAVIEGRNIQGVPFIVGYSDRSPKNLHDILDYGPNGYRIPGMTYGDQIKGRIVGGSAMIHDNPSIPGLYDTYADEAVENKAWVVNEPTHQDEHSAAIFANIINGILVERAQGTVHSATTGINPSTENLSGARGYKEDEVIQDTAVMKTQVNGLSTNLFMMPGILFGGIITGAYTPLRQRLETLIAYVRKFMAGKQPVPVQTSEMGYWVKEQRNAGRQIVVVQGLGFVGQAMASVVGNAV
ncbi:MAG: glycoside hydrolase family 9 protein, partial [Candidatus Omnitrophica bacterium]|nr:glycoside hydrolase family 9 protein [Candidatus Omnitrophota bacterium]